MPTPDSTRHWYRLSPDRLVVGLLLTVCLLWVSERFQWFGFNHHNGWTVLIAVATIGVAALVMLLWWAAGLIFRWRFQFGIRSLLVFCAAASIAAGWLAVEREQARRQADESINSDWLPVYDWQLDADGTPNSNPEPPEPRWLRKMLGGNFFSAVVVIYNNDPRITDAGLEHLKALTQLRELYLMRTQITDAGLEYLKELSQIQVLRLDDTNITDAGLEYLKGLTRLRQLNLGGTKVTDAGVERLQHSLPNCQIYYYY